MFFRLNRRAFLAGLASAAACPRIPAAEPSAEERVRQANERMAAIEVQAGGRLGVAVLDTGSGAQLRRRADERFPMCSTFKLTASAGVLKLVDEGKERLDRTIGYGPGALLEYAPVTKVHVGEGGMRLDDLCAAAIDWSDNTAANLILSVIGGPVGFTRFVRSLGEDRTRLDRNEPGLNTAIPGDARDTTTPLAMARDIQAVLLGDVLSDASKKRLEAWLTADRVGDKRLRAGLPPSWGVGDKTGSGGHGTANVIGIVRPPGRAPLLAAVYYTEGPDSMDARNAVHKEIGEIIAETF
jgi:beta-lactamase class A